MTRNDNKDKIISALRLLEKYNHTKEIRWLSETYFCEQKFSWIAHDVIGVVQPILKFLPKDINRNVLRTDDYGYARYYKEPICLDGFDYLVSKEWKTKSIHDFFEWILQVLGPNCPDLNEIKKNVEK